MLSVVKKIILIMVTGIAAMTCSEAIEEIPIPTGNNPPPVTETISDKDRHKVLQECGAFVDLLGDLTSEVAQQALVQFLMTKPEFEEAGISDKNVWAYFHDGRMALFIPNWLGADEVGGRVANSGRSAVNNSMPSPEGRTEGIPQTKTVTLFHGLGKAFEDDRPFLKDLFTKSKTSYKVDLQDASIENFKAVKDLGVFYIHTHGGCGLEKPKVAGIRSFMLSTTNPANVKNDSIYQFDLDRYRLVYSYAVQDVVGKPEWRYGITKHFVREYMTFAENAVQYLDACNGTSSSAESFRDLMIKKAGNGKATYIGWTAPSSSAAGKPTLRFIFDNLLGTNNQDVSMLIPYQRPFDLAAIFLDLKNLELGVSSHGGTLTYYTTASSKVILTPSIEYIDISDYESRMLIKGLFGDDPGNDGKVTVDGIAVPVQWSPELLICQLPDTGPGSSGDVVVSVRGNKSNVVPLSEWIIPLNVSLDQIGMTTEAILNLRVRADMHSYRSIIGENPRPPRGDSLLLTRDNVLGSSFGKGSTGTYSVGGQSRVTCKLGACQISDNKTVLTKTGKLPYLATPAGLGFAAYYKWSIDMKKLIVSLDVNIPNVGVEYESITVCPDIPSSKVSQSIASTFGIHNLLDPLSRLELTLDDSFTLSSGKKSRSFGEPPKDCTGTLQMNFTAQWSSATAAFPPTKDTEARGQ